MLHQFTIQIGKPPSDVFDFLCDKDKYKHQSGSPVLLLEKTTSGPLGVGTRYREVVQMMPFVSGEILSKITRFEPGSVLEEEWAGGGMRGILTYFFTPTNEGTELVQHVNIKTLGVLKPFDAIISRTYAKAAQYRLGCLKAVLETGNCPDLQKLKWWRFRR